MAGGGADLGLDRARRARALAAGAGAGRLQIAMVEATARLLRRGAEQAPLCVLLDDAHLADGTLLDAFELATLGRAGPVPLWICRCSPGRASTRCGRAGASAPSAPRRSSCRRCPTRRPRRPDAARAGG